MRTPWILGLLASLALDAAAEAETSDPSVLLGLAEWRDDPYSIIPPRAGMQAAAIWQISRDWDAAQGNWKKNPFSADGRYVHFTYCPRSTGDPFRTVKTGRVLYDLHLQRSRRVALDRWIWAWRHNWAFLSAPRGRSGLGPLLKWDLDTGQVAVAHPAFGEPLAVSADDRFVFASMSESSGEEGPLTRLDTETGELRVLPYLVSPRLECHPFEPVIALQKNNYRLEPDGAKRLLPYNGFLDLEGRFLSGAFDPALAAHTNWSGGGEWFVSGDGPLMGRRWDAGWPADWECLSAERVKDPQMCGLHKGYCVDFSNTQIDLVDVRTGEQTPLNHTLSGMVLPATMEGDLSHLYDVEAHGSPDGTKVYWSGTCDLAHAAMTRLTQTAREGDASMAVESTEGFPDSGVVVVDGLYAVGYRSKSPAEFDGIALGVEGTRKTALKAGWPVVPLSAMNLVEGEGLGRPRLRNSFITVARPPDPPALRREAGDISLYPGAHHQETRAYRFRLNGRDAGETDGKASWRVPENGRLEAAAVEWSNLRSEWSDAIAAEAGAWVRPRPERPAWLDAPTTETFVLRGKEEARISAEEARANPPERWGERIVAPRGVVVERREHAGRFLARREIVREYSGRTCKLEVYANGRLAERQHFDSDGAVIFREVYAPDGWKTEDWRATGDGSITMRFDKGLPVEKTTETRDEKGRVKTETGRITGKPKEWAKTPRASDSSPPGGGKAN
ncbi:MAG: hypothetical protein NTW86_19980 [Candidatus Sumerlaeota bacterium]|nr:hypothetical protein [Candidatus Sumerlaeota bacterium]